MTRTRILSLIAALALCAAALWSNVAYASSYYYYVVFYSDETLTVPVGEYRQYCMNDLWIITPQVTGQTSPYSVETPIGVCPGIGDW